MEQSIYYFTTTFWRLQWIEVEKFLEIVDNFVDNMWITVDNFFL